MDTCHDVPMPRPCRSPAMPSRLRFRLCLSHLIYTVRPCLIQTCHAASMPRSFHATTMPFWKRLLNATAQRNIGETWAWNGMCELASAVQKRHIGDLSAFGFFRLPRGVPRRLLSEAYNSLNCRTSSSDISGYHTDFHEGHGTFGEW
jgi:hypothetical protein